MATFADSYPDSEIAHQLSQQLDWSHFLQPCEHPSLGLILCAEKKKKQMKLLELDQSGIHGAEYFNALPSCE